jgi:hypothetical protein
MGIMNVLGMMQEARDVALSRGHNVKNWDVLGGDCYSLECKDCKMQVMVKEHPLPNEVQLGGEAIAVNCVKPEKKKLSKKT